MWALVTGGGKRLGAAISLSLAEAGYSVAVHYRHSKKKALETVEACRKKGVEAAAVQCDFDSRESVERFGHDYLEQFPDTHLLINNVGNYSTQSVGEIGISEWIGLFQTNLHAPFILSKVIGEALIKNRGQIINIGVSGLKRGAAPRYSAAYQLTKESLWAMTLSLAREWAPKQARVNMVSPGELDNSVDHHPIPMGRPGHVDEVCRTVRFLIDPKNSYITGQNIEVAGGLGL